MNKINKYKAIEANNDSPDGIIIAAINDENNNIFIELAQVKINKELDNEEEERI